MKTGPGPPADSQPTPAASLDQDAAEAGAQAATTVDGDGEGAVAIGGDVSESTIVTGRLYRLGLQRRWHWVALAAACLVLLAGASAAIYGAVEPLLKPPPADHMIGGLNVAVADFTALDGQGRGIETDTARKLAQAVFKRLDETIPANSEGAVLSVQVWPPQRTGPIRGTSREERAAEAERKALAIQADVVVYGTLRAAEGDVSFAPEFYLAPTRLLGAEELVGQYDFGSPLQSGLDLTSPDSEKRLIDAMQARTRALELFTYGIGHYERHEFRAAADWLVKADSPDWDDRDGKEVVYTLAGFAIGTDGDLERASDYFARALAINPGYARARMGASEMLFERVGATRECAPDRVDVDGLYESLRGFDAARVAPVQPAESNIPTKLTFGYGQVYLCLSLAQKEDDWALAESQFRSVVADYEAGNTRVKDLAAEAHSLIGYITMLRSSPTDVQAQTASFTTALAEYQRAIDLSVRPDRQAFFNRMQGYLHCRLADWDQASQAYDRAVGLESDATTQASYQELRRQLQNERVCA
jgi:tetratricopeptide (TPR) repeat protein